MIAVIVTVWNIWAPVDLYLVAPNFQMSRSDWRNKDYQYIYS